MNRRVDYSSRRIFHPVFCALVIGLLTLPTGARAEVVRSFDSQIRLDKDATLDVTETVVMDFESAQRHGIYRHIPTDYTRLGNDYSIKLRLLSVADEAGASQPYTESAWGRDFSLRIGDPHETVTGVHTYVIHYQVRRAVNFFDGHPEVYWNGTGDQWPFAMEHATVHFTPPPGVDVGGIRTAAYAGVPGSTMPGQIHRDGDSIVFSTDDLQPGQGLTIVAGLMPGDVNRPNLFSELLWWLSDWWPAIVLPLGAFVGLLALWTETGRDPGGAGAVAVEWDPPRGMSPAEVGTLIDESCDTPDIVSTLIDLAARGYLTIQPLKTEALLFLSKRDYKFTLKAPPPAKDVLAVHEKRFLKALFPGQATKSFLSELKGVFGPSMPLIRDNIYDELVQRGFFKTRPDLVRHIYTGWGLALLVVGVVATFVGLSSGHIAWGIGLALAGGVVLSFARAMPVKTVDGARAALECRGFQKFLSLVEKDRIAKMVKDDPTIFGRLLPYAMVLGVADRWAHVFDGLMVQPPDWYTPIDGYNNFTTIWFLNDLGRGMHSMSSGFTASPPSNTNWSSGWNSGGGGGGFSGFGGGGFSGGGFGGGGGGSW